MLSETWYLYETLYILFRLFLLAILGGLEDFRIHYSVCQEIGKFTQGWSARLFGF